MKQDKRKELQENWQVTKQHFECARTLLPSPLIENSELGSLVQFEEMIAYNELELALVELEALGELNNCSEAYWLELASAATSMDLLDRASYYQLKTISEQCKKILHS